MTRVYKAFIAAFFAALYFLVSPEFAGNLAVAIICTLSLGFVAVYAARSKWRATVAGRALLYSMASIGALTFQVLLSVWLGTEYPGRAVIRPILYIAVTLTLLHLLVTLIRVQNERDLK